MLNLNPLKAVFYFSIVYAILIVLMLGFFFSVKEDYDNNIILQKNKLSGIEYIDVLHDFTYQIISDSEKTPLLYKSTIEKLYELQEQYPVFKDSIFNQHLKSIKAEKFLDKNCYEFFDSLNQENYQIAEKSGLIFSNDKQSYLLASLDTHYLSELLISSGINYKISLSNKNQTCIKDNKAEIYLQQKKLIDLSILEVEAIISLLDDSNGEIDIIFQNILSISKNVPQNYKMDNQTDSSSLKKLFNESYKLIKLISIEANLVILNKKNILEKRLISYYFATAIAIFIITLVFIMLHTTYQAKVLKSRQLIKSQENLKLLNRSLQERVIIEIKKNKAQQEQSFQHSKLIQMGEMISMIAHQWRQPLNAISATSINLSLLSSMGKLEAQKVEQSSEFMQEQCQKMSATIDTFLNFVKPSKDAEIFLLSHALDGVMQIMQAQLTNKDIKVNIDIQEENIKTKGHEDLLEQVIINLLSNSRDAFEELKIKNKFIKITIFLKDTIPTISVEDNAGGIPDEISQKIFNPYFTTKEQGKGTGIGLYMSMDIMRQSFSGNLIYKAIDNGSCFEATCKGDIIDV